MAISDCGISNLQSKFEIVGRSRERDFAKLNLHLGIFDQPGEKDLFSKSLE